MFVSEHHASHLYKELRPRPEDHHPADAIPQQGRLYNVYIPSLTVHHLPGLPDEHPQLVPQQRRRRHLPGGAQARLHRSVVPGPGVHHPHGKPVRHEVRRDLQRHGRLAAGLPAGHRLRDVHGDPLALLRGDDFQPGLSPLLLQAKSPDARHRN